MKLISTLGSEGIKSKILDIGFSATQHSEQVEEAGLSPRPRKEAEALSVMQVGGKRNVVEFRVFLWHR